MVQIMGILNVTPDSFSDGGKFQNINSALTHAIEMAADGASVIDVGGESTRPDAEVVSIEEELKRVIPVIKFLKTKISIPISIDTTKSCVAYEACKVGASIINDVSAGSDPEMFDVARETGSEIILMHSGAEIASASPRNDEVIRNDTSRHCEAGRSPDEAIPVDVVNEVREYLLLRAVEAASKGIPQDKILLDPGIGFGKNVDENFELIKNLGEFTKLPYRIVLGASRKSFLRESGEAAGYAKRPDESQLLRTYRRLGGSIAVALYGANEGVSMVRVHDVEHTVHALKTAEKLKRY